ncbi:MAG: inositol monophosphatase [Candidatus Liptonbacteria bacterium]|nr:inositol monophosphatase [Candidatus Liptonbacteria bacterium]
MKTSEVGSFTINLAKRAGGLIFDFHKRRLEQIWADRTHFKTAADDASDKLIREAIAAAFPHHNIHSEEGGYLNRNSEYTWVCDAVDGTINLWSGFTDHFAVSLALCQNNVPIVGVVYAPKRHELYFAEQGLGAYLNGKPICASKEININHVLMGVDAGKKNRTDHLLILDSLLQDSGINCDLRTGCASVPLCLAASGAIHAYMATSLEPEDMAAAVIINKEAGNKVTNIECGDWKLGDKSILTANPELHQKILKLIS